MEFKGTKGEWKVSQDGFKKNKHGVDYLVIDIDSCCDCIEVFSDMRQENSQETLMSDAKLVAAAPELLRELIDTYNCCMENFETAKGIDKDVYKEIADGARKVINKALK